MQLKHMSSKSLDKILLLERRKTFGLRNIKRVLTYLDNPQNNLKTIHIAGTNGKGSVASIISAVLQEAGYKTGLFTSPHLTKLNERIRINKRLISDKDIERISKKINRIEKKLNLKLTFFETITTIAYLYFYEKKIDYLVLETGMGGRLDATNTCNPILTIITNIGLEHQEHLGNTLTKIAKEKAGIIKQAPLISKEKYFKNRIIPKKYNYKTNLKAEYQKDNLNTAVTALKHLKIHEKYIKSGLKKVNWPGRFEFFNNILIDTAHNPDGIKALIKSVKKLKYNNLVLIFSMMKDKEIPAVAKQLTKLTNNIILTKPNITRAENPDKLKKHFKDALVIKDPKKAIKYAKELTTKKDLILITGSIYFIGEVYSFLSHLTPK